MLPAGCSPLPPRTLDAPSPYSRGFRPLPFGSPRASHLPLCVYFVHQDFGTPPTFPVRAFIPCAGLLCPRLTSARSSRRLVTVVAFLQACRPPRVLRTHFLPISPSHLLPRLPNDYRALNVFAFSPRRGCLVCASCSSGRGFACRFLQTPPRGGSPCGSANGSRHQGP